MYAIRSYYGPQYYIGLKLIDDQHKVLVNLINLTYKYFGENNRKKLKEVLKELLDYTVYHFGEEEVLFKRFEYEDYDNHKRIHESFIGKIRSFKEDRITSYNVCYTKLLRLDTNS